jgi:uncharacterized protein affecting Mg2+/Co2+ transport
MGSMHGTYFCITEDAQPFEATISAFALKAEGEETERMLH